MFDELKISAIVIALMAALVALVIACAQPLKAKSCREDWAESKFQSRYGFWTDCQILTDRGWVPASAYRTTDKP